MNMKNCGHVNVRKHREINNGKKYINLDIYLNFFILENMKITSSEPEYYQVIPVKGLITSLGIKNIIRLKKLKKERSANTNVSLKEFSKIIKEFEDLTYEGYVRNSSKHMPTGSWVTPISGTSLPSPSNNAGTKVTSSEWRNYDSA